MSETETEVRTLANIETEMEQLKSQKAEAQSQRHIRQNNQQQLTARAQSEDVPDYLVEMQRLTDEIGEFITQENDLHSQIVALEHEAHQVRQLG